MSDEHKVSSKEFEEFTAAAAKGFMDCAAALDVARDALVDMASMFRSFERFYCRKCGKFFRRKELGKIESLHVPCPDCGDGLIPARNIG